MTKAEGHIPVMRGEVMAAFGPLLGEGRSPRILDGTFGGGGYSEALLVAGAQIMGIDRDQSAIARGEELRRRFPDRLCLVHGRFSALEAHLEDAHWDEADGIVLDIGMSSFQLDDAGRGFSFQRAGPLDMRMSPESGGPSADDYVNRASPELLETILRIYGEEKRARRITQFIVAARPIADSLALAGIIARAAPAFGRTHPATRSFQALRIAVNDEMGELGTALLAAERVLKPGGRLVIVSFHSLEDRIVKRFLTLRAGRVPGGSRHAPESGPMAAPGFSLRPEQGEPAQGSGPGPAEAEANPRARSARIRWGKRLAAPAIPDTEFLDPPAINVLADMTRPGNHPRRRAK